MKPIKVVISEEQELAFDGEQIFAGRSEEFRTEAGTRWFELQVFARQDGGFVPAIFYRSTCEPEVTVAEHVDDYNNVECFFYVFVPTEVLDEKKHMALPVELRQRLAKALTRLYDSQVNDALLAVRAYADEHPQSVTAPEKKPKKSLLGLFSKGEK